MSNSDDARQLHQNYVHPPEATSSAIVASQQALLAEISKRDKELIPLDGSPLDEAEKDRRVLLQLIEGDHFNFLRRFRAVNVLRASRDFRTYDEPGAGVLYMAAALAGEAGEYGELILISMLNAKIGALCNLIKKQERNKIGGPDHGFTTKIKDITPEKLRDEVGGIMAYLDLLCSMRDIDIEQATTECFNNVSEAIGSEYRV